ncbi:NAD(P)H-binding protein [Amycolatopsis sp. NPDC088138]|uniref:NAD(P)H-binding protein n=1 Tax=Amycolatopsis sp. NPDC088138 TaxID=3363938 RepID=UPI0037FF34BF
MITVMGATGNVGRPLVQALAEAGEQVTAISRQKTADVPAGVRVARDAESALDGAKALFLMVPGGFAPLDDLLAAARSSGVGRVVLLSSQGVATGRHPAVLEDSVRASGLKWTILRPGAFASNAFQWTESVRTARRVVAPFGDVALPVIDPEDIVAVAASALLSDRSGDVHELTGPAAITPRHQAAAISEALGEQVTFVPQTREEAQAAMMAFMPPEVANVTLNILGAPTPREQQVSPDVAQILGRPPRPFTAWATRNAGAFK